VRWEDDEFDVDDCDGCGRNSHSTRRKVSLGLDDAGSPMRGCDAMWSRKTSSTSGYSDMLSFDGGGSLVTSRKTSLADEDRTGASPERISSIGYGGAVGGSSSICGDETIGLHPPDLGFYDDVIDDQPMMSRAPPRPSASFPTFQLVIDDADVVVSKTTTSPSTSTTDGGAS
jgi:hypothetical protein